MTGYSQTRSACNNQNVLDVCIPSQQGWAVSFAGNIISGIRAQLLMDESSEPDYAPEDEINAQPVPISGKLVVSTLQAGLGYSCLRFDSYSLITSNNFLNLNYNKKYDFTAEDSEYTLILGLSEGMISNGQYYYRCQTNPNFDSKDTGSNVDTSKSSISAAFIAALVFKELLIMFLNYRFLELYYYFLFPPSSFTFTVREPRLIMLNTCTLKILVVASCCYQSNLNINFCFCRFLHIVSIHFI